MVPDASPYLATHDFGSDRSMSVTVLEAVADARDVDPEQLPRLDAVVSPDGLDAVLRTGHDRGCRTTVRFHYAGVTVTAVSDGTVVLEETGRPES